VARFLIRPAHGGQPQEIDDGAWPFFESQGYVIVSVLDSGDDQPLYLSAEESDNKYAQVGDIGDPGSSTGSELRAFFEQKISRDGATVGQVPVLQADGTLVFGASGGGSGTVTTVNGEAPAGGNVALTLDDIPDGASYVRLTVAQMEQLQLLIANGVLIIRHDGGADPDRPATEMHVIFDSPDANRPATNGTTAGGDYAAVDPTDYTWTR
jgi:hypothetical protein